jgi:hypothetical protein
MNIINKTMTDNKKNLDNKIKYALWIDNITTKTSIGKIPFELVYGMEAKLPITSKLLYFTLCNILQHIKRPYKEELINLYNWMSQEENLLIKW